MSLIFKALANSSGTITSIIDNKFLRALDPFILLDYGKFRLPQGFGDHPHRGFDTVGYIISGSIYHEDFNGKTGRNDTGSVQWMTAGRGIMHAELPASF